MVYTEITTRTVYEAVSVNERLNKAAIEIQEVLLDNKLSLSECVVVMDVLKHHFEHVLLKSDDDTGKVLFTEVHKKEVR